MFTISFNILLFLNVGVYWRNHFPISFLSAKIKVKESLKKQNLKNVNSMEKTKKKKLLCRFLFTYVFLVAADWLQGPYMFVLYESYMIETSTIGKLFVSGYLSSLLTGSFLASLADSHGRKKNVILYALLSFFSCFFIHLNYLPLLFLGRVLSGASTSILTSGLETWYISEYQSLNSINKKSNHSELSKNLSLISFTNYSVAIFSTSMIDSIAESAFLGTKLLVPYKLSALCCIVGLTSCLLLWGENYGNVKNKNKPHFLESISSATLFICKDPKVLALGVAQAAFEGSMYVFIFFWSPTLKSTFEGSNIPFGLIFSTFMLCCMLGSQVSSLSFGTSSQLLRVAITMMCAGFYGLYIHANLSLIYFFFIEFAVGLFYPSVGSLRATYVPNKFRSTNPNEFVCNLYPIDRAKSKFKFSPLFWDFSDLYMYITGLEGLTYKQNTTRIT
eukprot:snap_masked-scaffold_5-processed-gene-20.82-mRNA-1 protein AED:1.00 eAED:1.00 QI:0/0/0/0/1/1/2/0/445